MIWRKLFGGEMPTEVGPAGADPEEECDAVLDAALDWLESSTGDLRAGPIQAIDRFDLDLAAGRIAFTKESGEVLNFACQAVGTYNKAKHTFHWGWDHPSIPAEVAACSELVKQFGARFDLNAFTTRQIEAREEDAWQFAALAGMLSDSLGVYRCPSGDVAVFVTLYPMH